MSLLFRVLWTQEETHSDLRNHEPSLPVQYCSERTDCQEAGDMIDIKNFINPSLKLVP